MNKYSCLFKYIDLLSNDIFGKWGPDMDGYNSVEQPLQLPFVVYSNAVHHFIDDIHKCAEQTGIRHYAEILNRNGIEWDYESMSNADVKNLSTEAIFSLLLGAVRAERFCEGILLEFLKDGNIQKWLLALKLKVQTE